MLRAASPFTFHAAVAAFNAVTVHPCTFIALNAMHTASLSYVGTDSLCPGWLDPDTWCIGIASTWTAVLEYMCALSRSLLEVLSRPSHTRYRISFYFVVRMWMGGPAGRGSEPRGVKRARVSCNPATSRLKTAIRLV